MIIENKNQNKNQNKNNSNFLKLQKGLIRFKSDKAWEKEFNGYSNFFHFPKKIDFLNKKSILENIRKFISTLDSNQVYSLLPVIKNPSMNAWEVNDVKIILKSAIKINSDNTPNSIAQLIFMGIQQYMNNYNANYTDNMELIFITKIWKSVEDFQVSKENVVSSLEEVLLDSTKIRTTDREIIKKRIDLKGFDLYGKTTPGHYGTEINNFLTDVFNQESLHYKLIDSKVYKFNKDIYFEVVQKDQHFKVDVLFKNEQGKICFAEYPTISWIDTDLQRKFQSTTFFYKEINGKFKVDYFESLYKFPNFPVDTPNLEYNGKIGSIDFETMKVDGEQVTFCAAYAAENTYKSFYLNDTSKLKNEDDIVNEMIASMFREGFDSYTFYAHNLGAFDAFFLIKVLIHNNDYVVTPYWKDTKILSIKVKEKKTNKWIKFHDSYQLIPQSLDSMLKSFKCKHEKGIFPYTFVTPETVNYVGPKPDKTFFNDSVSNLDYNSILKDNYNLRSVALNYLRSDVEGLLEALHLFSLEIHTKYKVNITSYRTLPSMVMAIYTQRFYNENHNIKVIKGLVEQDIRESYKGGIVDVYKHTVKDGYYYDVNSQYPFAMLQDMPIGNPTFSTDTKLENYFGFVYVHIKAPSSKDLKIPILQNNEAKTQWGSYTEESREEKYFKTPRRNFSGWYYSEEIKNAIKFGYKCEIVCGYKFERGQNVFKNYIETIYAEKKNPSSPVARVIAKLMLNSLYGKFGQLEIVSTMKILDSNSLELSNIIENNNYSLFADLGKGKSIIKYTGKINEKIRKLLLIQEKENDSIVADRKRGTQAAVQIAAAISANARVIISEFKNIKGNDCVYSDTDSVILEKALDPRYIGNEIGQMKLENKVKLGIFISKKRYYMQTETGEEIKKAAGFNGKNLTKKDYISLLKGDSLTMPSLQFRKNWASLQIKIITPNKTMSGVKFSKWNNTGS